MYRQHDGNAGADQRQQQQAYQLSQNTSNPQFNQTQFSSPLYGLDPRLQRSPRVVGSMAQNHQLTPVQYTSADNHSSPRNSARSTPQATKTTFRPTDRSLPSKNVTAETIADAFVAFILYCNPNFPLDVNTSTLKSNFLSPPKSDNKDFETFRLFELIKKFDSKEIKTWAQLALDLGVEAPDLAKGQSVQKVQQYSVRLKRWMRATHIDAFFEFLIGNQHSYFQEIPYPNDPYPAGGRDGVLAEEDLAVRALDPSFRPKRGRRRNSETEQDERAQSGSAFKQPRLLEGAPRSAVPLSAMPMSAHPDGFHDLWDAAAALKPGGVAPWNKSPRMPQSAAPTSNPNPLRWQIEGPNQTPASPFALSALPSALSSHLDSEFDNEPRSAVTPTTRRRRKHGPAVSSAWPSTNAPGSKPRGRPPASRSIQDGLFGTFPADPTNEKPSNLSLTPISGTSEKIVSQEPIALPAEVPMFRPSAEGNGRPGRLSLQVPPRMGAPIRLATPPRVLVSDETNERNANNAPPTIDAQPTNHSPNGATPVVIPAPGGGHFRSVGDLHMHIPDREMPGFAFEVLRRVLASDLLRADLVGRQRRLTGDEAKGLADAILDRIGIPRADTNSSRDDIARLTAASWLGVGSQLNVPLGPAMGRGKRITVTRFRMNADGFEEILYDGDDRNINDDDPSVNTRNSHQKGSSYVDDEDDDDDNEVREIFDLSWNVVLGSCTGNFEIKGLQLSRNGTGTIPGEDTHDLLLRKSLEALNNIDRNGWMEESMHDIARSAARDSSLRHGRRRRRRQNHSNTNGDDDDDDHEDDDDHDEQDEMVEKQDENVDWKAKCKAMEFAMRVAKGELDRFKNRILEKVLDATL